MYSCIVGQYAYLKMYPCIVLINSTNNRYKKHKSNVLIFKKYSRRILINSTNNRYRRNYYLSATFL